MARSFGKRRAGISACRATRVRKLEAIRAKRATKAELIVVATIISRMIISSAFSPRAEFSAGTGLFHRDTLAFQYGT